MARFRIGLTPLPRAQSALVRALFPAVGRGKILNASKDASQPLPDNPREDYIVAQFR